MTQPRLLGGRYELDGIVGRGGMAEVFRARDIRLDRVVGVKTLRDDLARDQTFQARFRREAQSAASLNHPSIVAVYDTGEDMVAGTPVPYIVMEFVDGRTLRDLLRDDRRLLPERAAEITDGVLRALDYSHRNGIVHRDIKPGNVMLTRNGEVKVMDFGIARAVSDSQMTMTQTAQVIGTAQYLSPEQARGERVDARSDLYSTGCLLYELLTGRPPFTGDSPVAIAYQHVKEDPIPPSRIDPEVPPWADAIVLKAMQKDPADRYQSAGEMRNDLQRALAGAPVAAPMQTQTYGTRRMAGPPTQTAGRTAAIPPYRYGPEQTGTDLDRPKRKAWPWVVAVVASIVLVAAILGVKFLTGSGGGVPVPNVVNMKLPAAELAITKAGLKVGTITKQASSSVAADEVISSNPAFGNIANKGTAVNLVESSGASTVQVPSVVGDSTSQAESAITGAGLKPQIVINNNPPADSAPNTVISQSPSPSTNVKPGSVVKIYVPPSSVDVPNVIGLSQSSATSQLEASPLSFNVQVATCPNSQLGSVPTGDVCQTSPGPDTPVAPGSTITIYIEPAPSTPSPTASPTPTATVSPTPTAPPSGGI
jgi:eukaryotic-like serine/threonine-protein kinase